MKAVSRAGVHDNKSHRVTKPPEPTNLLKFDQNEMVNKFTKGRHTAERHVGNKQGSVSPKGTNYMQRPPFLSKTVGSDSSLPLTAAFLPNLPLTSLLPASSSASCLAVHPKGPHGAWGD